MHLRVAKWEERKEIQHCPFQWYACANHRSAITTMHKHAHTHSHTLPQRARTARRAPQGHPRSSNLHSTRNHCDEHFLQYSCDEHFIRRTTDRPTRTSLNKHRNEGKHHGDVSTTLGEHMAGGTTVIVGATPSPDPTQLRRASD